MMSLPSVDVVRNRIKKVKPPSIRICLATAYLLCTRISELVARKCPSDVNTTPRAIKGSDVNLMDYEGHEVALFKVRTAKRGGKERLVAIPLESEYEPWTKPLYDYFTQFGNRSVFPFTRQKVGRLSRPFFKGLTYPIESYRVFENGKVVKVVDDHVRPFALHALRHLRTTELIAFYGFNGFDLSLYGGWTLRTTLGLGGGGSFDRYAHLQWRQYFPKLLKRRTK